MPASAQRTAAPTVFSTALPAVAALTMVVTLGLVADGSANLAQVAPQAAHAISPPANWQLAFSSDFSGTTVDPSVWGECYPWTDASQGCTNFGNADEDEWYQESQIQVTKGVLDLIASPRPTAGYNRWGQPEEYDCTSGMVTTFPGFDFTYGFVQITARIPVGKGLWPAFWLVAQNGHWPPEIDIMEHWGTGATARATVHPVGGGQQHAVASLPHPNRGWHTFTLLWTPTRLTWWYDGKQVLTTTRGVPQRAMYLILNLADYNDSQGACNGTLSVKSVNIWTPTSSVSG